MSNVLITGCGGFIGSHLAEFMLEKGHKVTGTFFNNAKNIKHVKNNINTIKLDMRDKSGIDRLVQESRPDIIFHLAAQSFVVPSWEDPEETIVTNILGTLYLLESARKHSPEAVVVVACSSAEYGHIEKREIPVKEENPFRPSSPYAVSKIGQDMLSYIYSKAYSAKIIRVRFFNITGPRKTFDACSDFARRIAEVEKGKGNHVTVGNLDGLRDITDVRDAVRALYLLSEKGSYGEVYNICTGKAHRIGDLLEKLIALSGSKVKVVKSPDTRRRIDDPLFVGDNTKLTNMGWKPEIPIDKTLFDILDYWRNDIS